MFCTPADFNIPPYSIPNLSLYPNTFQTYIDTHEAAILKKLLGVELYYKALEEGVENLPPPWQTGKPYAPPTRVSYNGSIYESILAGNNKNPEQEPLYWLFIEVNKWPALGQGAIIIADGGTCGGEPQQIEWLGIKDMLIPFIFYCWLRDTWDNNSGIGVVQGKAENAEVITPARRLVDAYNSFAMKAATMHEFIVSSNTPDVVYEPYPYASTCGCGYPYSPGLINTFGI